jgi:hypothetical protein
MSGAVWVMICLALASTILALGLSKLLSMRVSEGEEGEGLDITSHGERGWESIDIDIGLRQEQRPSPGCRHTNLFLGRGCFTPGRFASNRAPSCSTRR